MSSRRVLKAALYLLCASGVIAALVYSPLFTFQQLVVHGNVHLDEAELCEIARIHYGERLFEVKTDAITTNLLHDLRIESAVVRRQLPNKIEMEIVERVPVATVACDYGYLDFDRQGKVIASYRSLKGADIPIITGVKLSDSLRTFRIRRISHRIFYRIKRPRVIRSSMSISAMTRHSLNLRIKLQRESK